MQIAAISCHHCGDSFERPLKEITRSRKQGRESFCTQACASSFHGRKYKSETRKNLFVTAISDSRKRARKTGMEWDLCEQQLVELLDRQKGRCAMSGVALDVVRDGGNPLFYVSIDRVDNDGGYTVNNVQLTCRGVNYMKNRWTDEQAMELLIAIACK